MSYGQRVSAAASYYKLTNEAIGQIAHDIAAREDIKGKRIINVKIEFTPKGTHIAVGYNVEAKLPKEATRTALAFVDTDGNMVTELRKQRKLPMESNNHQFKI